jgi:hypothetical protein
VTEPRWEPSNDLERALLEAALADDRASYFRLVAVADLYLPQLSGEEAAGQRFVTVRLFEHTFLPVFTSWQALGEQFRGVADAYTVTNYAELSRKWPDPRWRLAINPGTPLDAYLPVEGVADAAVGDVEMPTLREMYAVAEEDDETEERLRERRAAASYSDDPAVALTQAAEAGDAYGYVEQLLRSVVLVPTSRPADADTIVEPEFPWLPAARGKTIDVFTSRAAFARVYADSQPAVEVEMPFALVGWPEGYGLAVNPGSDDGIDFDPEQVLLLFALE